MEHKANIDGVRRIVSNINEKILGNIAKTIKNQPLSMLIKFFLL
jgi:hypothetical protein